MTPVSAQSSGAPENIVATVFIGSAADGLCGDARVRRRPFAA